MGKAWSSWMATALVAVAGLIGSAAWAADLSDRDVKAVRAVVSAQLDAMAADDAASAFSYASPGIRTRFGDAATFMAVVREAYPMVVHPAAVSFFVPHGNATFVHQAVLLRDADGQQWIAVYSLTRQPDKSWRIEGCSVAPDDGKSST